MFCPNCGEKLENPNQPFCSRCGSEIQTVLTPEISQEPQVPVVKTPVPPPTPVAPQSVPIYQPKTIKKGGIGSNSKMCFAFALVSLAFFAVGLGFGAGVLARLFIPVYFIPYLPGGPGMWFIAFILHVIGFIFAIISRVNGNKASKREGENALQKVGSVFGVFGIVLNVIPLLIIPIASVLSYIPPYYSPYI
jgi:hypothetical protein